MNARYHNVPDRVLRSYGCSREFWIELREVGMAMMRAGISRARTPIRAFRHQRANAAKRGVGWTLTLPEWWSIWQTSGKWEVRGVGRGYQMCRFGDVGPYAPANVFIGEGALNVSAPAKRSNLPTGVAWRGTVSERRSPKPYRAYCHVNRRLRHLGCFATVAEAEAAYREARSTEVAA